MTRVTRLFSLKPHPASAPGAVERVHGTLSLTPSLLHIQWRLDGDLSRLAIPPPAASRPADELWRHTCFEAFVAAPGAPGYFEFNFSPSGEWAAYRFGGYRERIAFDPAATAPGIARPPAAGGLALDAEVPRAGWPEAYGGPLMIALSAVIEAADGALSYWALAHPAARPDFHHPDGFVLELR